MTDEAHIVALSGGKDSTAMALRLSEVEPREYTYVCTPTGDEPPELYAHWEKLESMLRTPILKLKSGHTLNSLIKMWNAVPNGRMRWCTRMLKIQPFQAFVKQQINLGKSVTVYVGLRADEEERGGVALFRQCKSEASIKGVGVGSI